MEKTIIKVDGKLPGPKVAIFCGIHGNEQAGIMTVNHLRDNLKIDSGTLYLVYANPKAIEENRRFIEKNLNRCFLDSSKKGKTYEEKRAVKLMKLLDECDGLLDLHAYSEPDGEAKVFVITELNSLEIVKNIKVNFVLTGIDSVEQGGTDAYMSNQEKIGICLELGSIETPEKFVNLGITSCYTFLNYFGMTNKTIVPVSQKQTILKVTEMYKRKDKNFSFAKRFKTFGTVNKNELICTDGNKKVCAKENGYILFPRDCYDVGIEAFLIAKNKKAH